MNSNAPGHLILDLWTCCISCMWYCAGLYQASAPSWWKLFRYLVWYCLLFACCIT